MTEEVLNLIVGLDTAREIRTCLAESFAGVSKERERELNLIRELPIIRKDNLTVAEYLRKFKTICAELAAIQKPVKDSDKVCWAINGLGSKYESFTNALITKPTLPTFSQFVSSLVSLESRTQLNNPKESDTNHFQAHVGQKKGKWHQTTKNWSQGQTKNKQRFSSTGHGFAQALQPHGRNDNAAATCTSRDSNGGGDIPKALAAMTVSDPNDTEWIPDTGATSHMTNDAEWLAPESDSPLKTFDKQRVQEVIWHNLLELHCSSPGKHLVMIMSPTLKMSGHLLESMGQVA
ncbi:hypothetical protein Acr_23g0013300 [Actinidia rufa]|uniref:Uncharacterized protein n=1 Tax=Actinidia rufa TaxID=165716 RepID=A0A7J0GQ56_9ERIC|nr:hypothetical protein Acr_23g0013300 [Actinidia rufa]